MDGRNCVRLEEELRPAVHRPAGTADHIRPEVRTSGEGLGGWGGRGGSNRAVGHLGVGSGGTVIEYGTDQIERTAKDVEKSVIMADLTGIVVE